MPRVKTQHGVTLYYETVGEGPPMIFHAHHHRQWMYTQIPFFSRYFQAIAYDLRGTGRSSCPPGKWTPEDLSRDCAGLMDALGLERAIIVGASKGGDLTMQFGVDYPERASALIATDFTWWKWDLLIAARYAPALRALETADSPENVNLLEEMGRVPVPSWEWEARPPILIGPEFEASEFMPLLAESGALSFGQTPEAARAIIELAAGWDLRPRLKDLKKLPVPTLIMVGNAEPTHLIGNAWELYRLLPNAEFVLLNGHHTDSRFVDAIGYNRKIRDFLDRHRLLPPPAEPAAVSSAERVESRPTEGVPQQWRGA